MKKLVLILGLLGIGAVTLMSSTNSDEVASNTIKEATTQKIIEKRPPDDDE
ncbi:MAG: hypothetical protein GY909_00405 [Oligoflexia bacterium]|nr:hypothetical protein [Oligoflexia bacterium]